MKILVRLLAHRPSSRADAAVGIASGGT